ncbi:TPA: TIGR01212 family radical SAM protein [bacterium]|nr:TIGR01212 family radical SAM protein [bacterium]
MQERYYKFSSYLKRRFSQKVHKISVDAGFSCPNRDGTKSKEGCIFCNNRGFSLNSRISPRPLELQIKEGMDFNRARFGAERFIIYFQAYTNTYASLGTLKERYDTVKRFKDIVGISIGTRPDCIDEDILSLIDSYTEDYEVWLEYGLQTIHEKTLAFINRGHTYQDFLRAVELTRKREKIKVCAHVIIGLPGESMEMVLETAKELGRLKLEGIKIHPLHVIRGTRLEEMFSQGLTETLELDEYLELVTRFLEYLWPETVIQRISANCPREFLVDPLWILQKGRILEKIEERLLSESKFQGRLWVG